MNHDQQVRYSRNISLDEVGYEGQTKLLNSKVLVVGAGGLGCPVIAYLSSSGIGTIGVVDDDVVALSNLQRQILHEQNDIGILKTQSVKEFVFDLNADVNIVEHNIRISEENISDIISNYDIMVDASDNIATRLLLNDKCFEYKKVLISGAIEGFVGQVSTFKAYVGSSNPCYRCLYPNINNDTKSTNCNNSGVISSIAGVIGSIQATQVIKEILNIGKSLSGSLLVFDLLNNRFKQVKLLKNNGCICCN